MRDPIYIYVCIYVCMYVCACKRGIPIKCVFVHVYWNLGYTVFRQAIRNNLQIEVLEVAESLYITVSICETNLW